MGRRPTQQRNKSFWRHPVVVAAIVAAVGAVAVAVIERGLTRPDTTNEDFISSLSAKARQVVSMLDSLKEHEAKARFLELHAKHLDAVRAGQLNAAHELSNQIDGLLRKVGEKPRDIVNLGKDVADNAQRLRADEKLYSDPEQRDLPPKQ